MLSWTILQQLKQKRCGFRISEIDIAAIAICGIATWLLRPVLEELTWLFPITLGHFFLFCNVFRVRRSYELLWAAIFIANVTTWFIVSDRLWFGVLTCQSPVTVLLVLLEVISSRYHGIFCKNSATDAAISRHEC